MEVKLSTGSYIDGLIAQLPVYKQASGVKRAIYVLVRTQNASAKLSKLNELVKKLKAEGKTLSKIVIIEGWKRRSGSKLKGIQIDGTY